MLNNFATEVFVKMSANHNKIQPTEGCLGCGGAALVLLSALLLIPVCAQGAITFLIDSEVIPATEPWPHENTKERVSRVAHAIFCTAVDGKDKGYNSSGLDLRYCSENLKDNPSLVTPSLEREHGSYHFAYSVMQAYKEQRPVTITPDAVWTTILQGVVRHISANRKTYQQPFVDQTGPRGGELHISSDSLQSVESFTSAVYNNIENKALRDVVTGPFSTSSTDDQLAFGLTFLSTVQDYFQYWDIPGSIPQVTLAGTAEDWIALKQRTDYFRECHLELDWWIDALQPILEQFIAASQGEINQTFWRGMMRHYPIVGYGQASTYQNHGWLTNFFPYTNTGGRFDRNEHLLVSDLTEATTYDQPHRWSLSIPRTFAKVGIRDSAHGGPRNIEASAGVLAVQQQSNLALKPIVGWVMFGRHRNPK